MLAILPIKFNHQKHRNCPRKQRRKIRKPEIPKKKIESWGTRGSGHNRRTAAQEKCNLSSNSIDLTKLIKEQQRLHTKKGKLKSQTLARTIPGTDPPISIKEHQSFHFSSSLIPAMERSATKIPQQDLEEDYHIRPQNPFSPLVLASGVQEATRRDEKERFWTYMCISSEEEEKMKLVLRTQRKERKKKKRIETDADVALPPSLSLSPYFLSRSSSSSS